MSHELMWQMGLAFGTACAIYGGIRADLKAMHERINQAIDAASAAHKRIDAHLDKA